MGILRWLRQWRDRRELEEDLARELDTHLAVAREEQIERGLSATAAGHAVQRQLGSVTYLKEEMREMWGWMFTGPAFVSACFTTGIATWACCAPSAVRTRPTRGGLAGRPYLQPFPGTTPAPSRTVIS